MTFWRTRKNTDGSLAWETFTPIDTDRLLQKMRPKDKGGAFAVSAAVVTDDASLTSDEIEMLGPVGAHITELQEWYQRRIGAIRDTINEVFRIADLDQVFDVIKQQYKSAVAARVDRFHHEQDKNYHEKMQLYRQLRRFQSKHDLLDRVATYPESLQLHLAIVFVAMLIESVANAYFYGQASGAGLLGGFLTAFVVSLANVAISMLAGWLLTSINHKSTARKIAGMIGVVVCTALIILTHLSAAHYREALTRNPDANIVAVLPQVWTSPFALQDMESLLLIVIGLVISAVSMWKGYTLDDPYPGYGPVYRSWKLMSDRLSEIELSLKQDVGAAFDTAISGTQKALADLTNAKRDMAQLEGDINASLSSCDAHYATARKAAMTLLTAFRNEVHTVTNDQTRFPIREQLLDGENGLPKLDPKQSGKDVQDLYSSCIRRLESAIMSFPARQKPFVAALEADRARYASPDAIARMIDEIGNRRHAEERAFDASASPSAVN